MLWLPISWLRGVVLVWALSCACSLFPSACAASDDEGIARLAKTLEQAAGVYMVPPAESANKEELQKIVLVSAGNFPYMRFLDNFVCYMNRLQFKLLVLAMDDKMHAHASQAGQNIFSYHWNSSGVESTTKAALFNTPQFHTITTKKEEGVLQILKLGYSVIFIDMDIALFQDPLPYFLWKNVDYVHSLNQICPQ
jgi:hypothetical protein